MKNHKSIKSSFISTRKGRRTNFALLFILASCLPNGSDSFLLSDRYAQPTFSFLETFKIRQQQQQQQQSHLSSCFYEDFEDFASPEQTNSGQKDDDDWFAALRARQESFELSSSQTLENNQQKTNPTISEQCLDNWKEANCASTVRLALDDWIRRMAIDTYPLAVCGSASGHVYLCDLQRGQELDCLQNVHIDRIDEKDSQHTPQLQNAIETLYGRYDGGGVVAIDIRGDLIASAGREGGVCLSRITGQEEDFYKGSRGGTARQTKLSLRREGPLRGLLSSSDALVRPLITSLKFDDEGVLWMGGYDGILRAYDSERIDSDDKPMMLRQKYPLHEKDVESPILSIDVNNELGCGVGTTRDKGMFLFSLEDGQILATWRPFGKRDEFFRTAIIVQNNPEPNSTWSVVCGGSEGTMFQRKLNVDSLTGFVSEKYPFQDMTKEGNGELPTKLRPNHMGTIVAMASPAPGLLVSGAQDGNIRVWDCSYPSSDNEDDDEEDEDEEEAQYDDVGSKELRPRCLYAMTGYKVWLGSIFANGKKLVSDGADNTVIVHSFDEDEEDVMFRDDEDEGLAYE